MAGAATSVEESDQWRDELVEERRRGEIDEKGDGWGSEGREQNKFGECSVSVAPHDAGN